MFRVLHRISPLLSHCPKPGGWDSGTVVAGRPVRKLVCKWRRRRLGVQDADCLIVTLRARLWCCIIGLLSARKRTKRGVWWADAVDPSETSRLARDLSAHRHTTDVRSAMSASSGHWSACESTTDMAWWSHLVLGWLDSVNIESRFRELTASFSASCASRQELVGCVLAWAREHRRHDPSQPLRFVTGQEPEHQWPVLGSLARRGSGRYTCYVRRLG